MKDLLRNIIHITAVFKKLPYVGAGEESKGSECPSNLVSVGV